MKLTLLTITFASLCFAQTAKICITNPQGATICNSITNDAFASAADFAKASCRDIPAVTDKDGVVTTPASTKCEYANARQVILKHVEGYLRDLKQQYPQASLKKLKTAADNAVAAVTTEQAKPILTEVAQ